MVSNSFSNPFIFLSLYLIFHLIFEVNLKSGNNGESFIEQLLF